MQTVLIEDFLSDLSQILQCHAFELHIRQAEGKNNFYIPYMMNDALECYFILENGQMTGTWISVFSGNTTAELIEEENRWALIFRQGEENVFTLWFTNIRKHLTCYPYHEIGHFWVKGQEQWRQMVYITGTIYDKYEYLGNLVCSPAEKELLPLMEFAPFRMWSPVHESLEQNYPDTWDGLNTMKMLAHETNSHTFCLLLALYPFLSAGWYTRFLAHCLTLPLGQKIYERLYQKIKTASEKYSARSYAPEHKQYIQQQRTQAIKTLHQHGFTGTYPYFQKGRWQVIAAEEHPFTILESKDFTFRIQYMVSYSQKQGLNAGFFRKHGNHGAIYSDLQFLDTLK